MKGIVDFQRVVKHGPIAGENANEADSWVTDSFMREEGRRHFQTNDSHCR